MEQKVVHKKYTYKHGRKYGPYFYSNKRVGNRVITTYLGDDFEEAERKEKILNGTGVGEKNSGFGANNKIFILIISASLLIVLASLFFLNNYYDLNAAILDVQKTASDFAAGFYSFINGLVSEEAPAETSISIPATPAAEISAEPAPAETIPAESAPSVSELSPVEPAPAETAPITTVIPEAAPETAPEQPAAEPAAENQTIAEPQVAESITPVNEIITLENQTAEENITIINQTIIIQNETLENIPTANETLVNITTENITAINETIMVQNETIQNITEANITKIKKEPKIKTSRSAIRLGERVKWVKNVTLESSDNITLELPSEAEDIVVKKIEGSTQTDISAPVEETADKGNKKTITITGGVIAEPKKQFSFFEWLKNIFGMTGEAVVDLEAAGNASEYIIEYYTEAPTSAETDTNYGKKIVISGPENLNYTDILSFTNIPEIYDIGQEENIRIKWVEDNSFVIFDAYDNDGNGKLDYVEWITPHLSNQTFEIILITKAEHLDSNRSFIENAYEEVKERDGNFKLIPAGDYLRVTFEHNLTSDRDITIYARANSTSSIEVYEKDNNDVLATFENVAEDKEYKIYLTNLTGEQGTFDLKALGGVEFDWVVDPSKYNASAGTNTIWECGNITSNGTYTVNQSFSTTTTCILIQANNVILDGAGFNIDGDDGATDYGITATSRTNITIKNINITDFNRGVFFSAVTNSTVKDSYFTSNPSYGVLLSGGSGNLLLNNTADSSTQGLRLDTSSVRNIIANNNANNNSQLGIVLSGGGNNNVSGNTVSDNGGGGTVNSGIYLAASSNNIISSNTLERNGGVLAQAGIYIEVTSNNNSFFNNYINSNLGDGIQLNAGSNNSFTGDRINNSARNGVLLRLTTSTNTRFTNVTIINTSSQFYDINFNVASINRTTFIDCNFNIFNFNNSGIVTFESTNNAKILFLELLTAKGNNLSEKIRTNYNLAHVNSSILGFNVSANITFYNLPTTMTNPKIYRDDAECNETTSPPCFNFTSLNAGNVTFNVTSWSNYSIQDQVTSHLVVGLPAGLSIVDSSNESIDFTNVSQTGVKSAFLKIDGSRIAIFNIDFSSDVNLSDISGNSTNVSENGKNVGKSFVHIPANHSEISNITLFIPVYLGSGIIYVCPNATSISEVNSSCPNKYYVSGLSNVSGYLNVSVTGTGAAESSDSLLVIWDSTDAQAGSQSIDINQQARFYANYTVIGSNATITGAACNFTENSSGSFSNFTAMAYNSTSKLYEYNKTFNRRGIFAWNATCYGNSSFSNLTANNTIAVTLNSNLTIIYRETACSAGEADILHISAYDDGHAEIPSASNFSIRICAKDSSGSNNITNSSGTNFLDLFEASDSHVEQPGEGTAVINAYIDGSRDSISCDYNYTFGVCSSGKTCVSTISNNTDAHIGNCSAFNLTVCCGFSDRDTTPPTMTIISPLNQTYFSSTLNFNVTLDETGSWCGYSLDGAANVTMTQANLTSFGYTATSLANGGHAVVFSCNDTLGNMGSASRDFSMDIGPPNINFTNPTPTNGSNVSEAIINVSIIESNLAEMKFNWNGTNYSHYDSSLKLMYNFDNVSAVGDNATQTADISRSSFNGTIIGGASYTANGRYNGALTFDGINDYVNTNDGLALNGASEITLAAWFYSVNPLPNYDGIIAARGAGVNGQILSLADGNTIYFAITNATTPAAASTTGISLSNNWHYLAGTWKSGEALKLYLDGVFNNVSSTNLSGTIDQQADFFIGLDNQFSRFFNGTIDEPRIWNRSLSAEEIRQQYYSNLNKYDTNKWALYTRQTNLTAATYTFQASAKDTDGNENQTEMRTINIVSAGDTTAPILTIISPNSTAYAVTILDFNISANENLSYCTFTLDNWLTNYTMGAYNSTYFNYTRDDMAPGAFTARFSCNDTAGNINGSTIVQFNVSSLVSISLPVNFVDFGNLVVGQTVVNLSGIQIQNDGNVYLNIDINATDIWAGTHSYPGNNYLFRIADAGEGNEQNGTFSSSSKINWTQMSSVQTTSIFQLNYINSNDLAAMQLNMTVPGDEPFGEKSSTVYIVATEV